MPKSRSATAPAPRDSTEQRSPVQRVQDAADALLRAAMECCHQHDRIARIVAKAALEDEVTAAQRMCEACHEALATMSQAYEAASSDIRPSGKDEVWWHKANALWLASREYLRRNGGCDDASRKLKEHGPERLGELHAEYELEASALLALRQAADAYKGDRPTAA